MRSTKSDAGMSYRSISASCTIIFGSLSQYLKAEAPQGFAQAKNLLQAVAMDLPQLASEISNSYFESAFWASYMFWGDT